MVATCEAMANACHDIQNWPLFIFFFNINISLNQPKKRIGTVTPLPLPAKQWARLQRRRS